VLIFEVLETTQLPIWKDNMELEADAHELSRELYDIWDKLDQQRLFESWHDALQIREEALDRFSLGLLDLRTRAEIEKLFWSIAREVGEIASSMKHVPEELRKISKMIPDKYFCNFSLFQSLPDSWAIDQIFPIIPISRLDEKPSRTCTLQDMTCDSDGKIANFIAPQGTASSLPVHPLRQGEPYYLGVFLVGAYQEILGDMHNLFGDTNAVHIDVYKDRYEIDQVIEGETVDEVLDYVQFSAKKLVRNVESWVTASMKAGTITPEEGRNFISTYRSGLFGYTYLERD
jgi:arginine decarboxylase